MSLLGFMSVKLDRQQTLLEGLNEALLIVQSESLGRAADLGFTPEQIAAAKETLRDFVSRLREKLGSNQNDDLNLGKRHFRERDYGLAERYFRRAVEMSPRDVEAWIGLAASYDRLKRFDHADRAYAQALRILGPTPEILNNQGYSYLLRGDYKRARVKLYAARAKDPASPRIQNNIDLLEESLRRGKGVEAN